MWTMGKRSVLPGQEVAGGSEDASGSDSWALRPLRGSHSDEGRPAKRKRLQQIQVNVRPRT